MTKPTLFISYSRQDRPFARRIQVDAEANNCLTWFDEKDIQPGDSVPAAITRGLESCDVFVLLVSVASQSSGWVQREYETALSIQLQSKQKRPRLVPALLDLSTAPVLLKPVRWVSFSDSYTLGITELLSAAGVTRPKVRTDHLLREFEELRAEVTLMVSERLRPDHHLFDRLERLEQQFNELRRCIAGIQPLSLDRRFWLISSQAHLPLRDRTFALESDAIPSFNVDVRRFAERVSNYAQHPDIAGILGYPARRFFGASGGSSADGWYMSCAGSGIFRNSPYDGASPYVRVGSKITDTTIMCRIENGPHSSEMLATSSGILTEVCVRDGEQINMETVLFRGVWS